MPIRARHESEKQLVSSKIGFPYSAQGILLSPCDIWIGRLDTMPSKLIFFKFKHMGGSLLDTSLRHIARGLHLILPSASFRLWNLQWIAEGEEVCGNPWTYVQISNFSGCWRRDQTTNLWITRSVLYPFGHGGFTIQCRYQNLGAIFKQDHASHTICVDNNSNC